MDKMSRILYLHFKYSKPFWGKIDQDKSVVYHVYHSYIFLEGIYILYKGFKIIIYLTLQSILCGCSHVNLRK